MIIKTKFNKGQRIWTIHDNKPYEFEVQAVKAEFDYYGAKVSYNTNDRPSMSSLGGTWFDQDKCYSSKQSLLKSL